MNDNNNTANVNRVEVVKTKSGYIISSWSKDKHEIDVSTSLPEVVEKLVEHLQWEYK